MDVKEKLARLTLEEKAGLCCGIDYWSTVGIERLDIPSMTMADGPHGLRKQIDQNTNLTESIKAVCFPTASALACSWNKELLREVGNSLGEVCKSEDVDILLGPGINIKRSPVCGRNFEYFSEDPLAAGELAAAMIIGLQERNVGASLKHYAANNQEHLRSYVSAQVDERTLREIYLKGFEIAIKKSQPWTVMCAYNRLNGEFCSENKWLLTDVLRGDFKFEGVVITDWGAVNNRVKGIKAGCDIEMPFQSNFNRQYIVESVENGTLSIDDLDRVVERIIRLSEKKAKDYKRDRKFNLIKQHELAQRVAAECIVLLKNEDEILPIDVNSVKKIAFIGQYSLTPRTQGGGSSHINVFKTDSAYEEFKKIASDMDIIYAEGFNSQSDTIDQCIVEQARKAARESEYAIVFVGLPDRHESEGHDRQTLDLPENHVMLINEVAKCNRNTVVVLNNGSPVAMPWINNVKAVLEAYLSGGGGGHAVAKVLAGIINPSGKLSETFPVKLSDTPCYLSFPGFQDVSFYNEGIFTGYRYYEKKDIAVLFPFGFGLSYTQFEYSNLDVSKEFLSNKDTLLIKVDVKNTGNRFGKEAVQIYISNHSARLPTPVKELKAFEKISLNPGEEKTVVFEIAVSELAQFDKRKGWVVDSGEYDIIAAKSSRDVCLIKRINILSDNSSATVYNEKTSFRMLAKDQKIKPVVMEVIDEFKDIVLSSDGSGTLICDQGEDEINMFVSPSSLVMASNGRFSYQRKDEFMNKIAEVLLKNGIQE